MHIGENFYIGLAFVLFLYFIYKPLRKMIKKGLDEKISKISEEFTKSNKLKEEAKELLLSVEEKLSHLPEIENEIIEKCKKETEEMLQHKVQLTNKKIKKLQDNLQNSVVDYEKQVNEKVKNYFIDSIMNIVQKYLEVDGKNHYEQEIISRISNIK